MKSSPTDQLLATLQESVAVALKRWLDENKNEILRAIGVSFLAREAINKQGQLPSEHAVKHANLLTACDVAERWQFHPESVRRMIRQGRIPHIIIGRQLRVAIATVEEMERSGAVTNRR